MAAKQAAALAATTLALGTSSVTDLDCSLLSSPMDPFFDPITSFDRAAASAGRRQAQPRQPAPAGQAAAAAAVRHRRDSRHARREDAAAVEGPAAALCAHASAAAAVVSVVVHVC